MQEILNRMKNTLIITGGTINEEFAREYIQTREFDYIIAVDDGLRMVNKLGLKPDCILGDFDTVSPLLLFNYEGRDDIEIIRFKPEKDYTDTSIAISKALEEGSITIQILGGTGTRLDHTIANVMLLQQAMDAGVEAVIVSEKNRIRLLGHKRKRIVLMKDKYKYVSLLPLTWEVRNVTIKGMKYNVTKYNFCMDKNIGIGVSNEILDTEGEIIVEDGLMILIESND